MAVSSLVGFVIAYAAIVLWVGAGWAAQKHRSLPLFHCGGATRWLLRVLLLVTVAGVTAVTVRISYASFLADAPPLSNTVAPSPASDEKYKPPLALALADGAIVLFGVVVLPIPKYMGVGRLSLLSFEQLVWIHLAASFGLFGMMVAHAVAMQRIDGVGLVVAIASGIAILGGLLRHYVSYKYFRITHLSGVVALVFVVIHAGRSLIMLVPGGLLWLIDCYLRIRDARAGSSLVTLAFNPINDLISLTIDVEDGCAPPVPGQFALLLCPDIDYIPHPFSVASCETIPVGGAVEESSRVSVASCPLSESPTLTVKRLTFFIRRRPSSSSWTYKLSQLALNEAAPQVTQPLRVCGFHGELQVPLRQCATVILIAGGIGVTPMLHIFDSIAQNPLHVAPLVTSIHFLWVGRDEEDVRTVNPNVDKRLTQLQTTKPDVTCQFTYFSTQSRSVKPVPLQPMTRIPRPVNPDGALLPSQLRQLIGPFRIVDGRPKWPEELLNYRVTGGSPVGCYICGPEPLMEESAAAARACSYFVHTEAFQI